MVKTSENSITSAWPDLKWNQGYGVNNRPDMRSSDTTHKSDGRAHIVYVCVTKSDNSKAQIGRYVHVYVVKIYPNRISFNFIWFTSMVIRISVVSIHSLSLTIRSEHCVFVQWQVKVQNTVRRCDWILNIVGVDIGVLIFYQFISSCFVDMIRSFSVHFIYSHAETFRI